MSKDDFNSVFANLTTGQLPPALHDPRYVAHEIMRRDQLRTRILALLSLTLWLIGATGMIVMLVGLSRLVVVVRIADHFGSGAPRTQPADDGRQHMILEGTQLLHRSIPYITGSIACLMLAAMLTVVLIFSSRRATLNRINFSLMHLSEQLAQLRQGRGPNGGS